MSKKPHKKHPALLPPRFVEFHSHGNGYGQNRLDTTWDETRPDPRAGMISWSRIADTQTSRSEAIGAVLILIESALSHALPPDSQNDVDLDFRGFCVDAKLTDRQMEVVLLIAEGWGVLAIAECLGITRQAVSMHLHRGRCKLTRQTLPIDAYYREQFPKPVAKVV